MLPKPAPLLTTLKQLLPQSLDKYLRLGRYDKPIGSHLFFLPAAWGLALASPMWYPSPTLMLGCYVSAAMIRGAGCAVNDWWDRDYDRQVERCKTRPIASGEINTAQAVLFFTWNSSPLLLGLLAGPLPTQLSVCALLPMYCTYPLFKRITYWPQVMLGFTFNMGTIIAYTLVTGELTPAAVALYLGGVSQTILYDTLYAYQDRDDDVKAGVKSTALRWGEHYKEWSTLFTGISAITWTATGVMAGLDPSYYLGVTAAIGHMIWQYTTIDINSKKDCWNKFASNTHTCLFLLGGIMMAKWRMQQEKELQKRVQH